MKKEKLVRIAAKYVHVTLHKLNEGSRDYWLDKAMSFRRNVVSCLVGLEENHEEGKGLHAHIVIQFSTVQQLSRNQFVSHFGTDCLHVSTKPGKEALLMALGYISKTGNVAQKGVFTYRGMQIDPRPEVYRFQYQVRSVDDGLDYFHKMIREGINNEGEVIARTMERPDAIGRWLQRYPAHARTLQKLEHSWKLDERNRAKKGFEFESFTDNDVLMRYAYNSYLREFPKIFDTNKAERSRMRLEGDYADHADSDLSVLKDVIALLRIAKEYGPRRPFKSLNLYLWSSRPSFGKTRLLNFLNSVMVAYRLPDDQYYVDYENFKYYVLVNDEAEGFLRSKDYSHLKLLFEGSSVEFNRKNRTKVMKYDNPLIVLAENDSFNSLMSKYFKGVYKRSVMDARLLDLELKSRATLHFLLDKCIRVNK